MICRSPHRKSFPYKHIISAANNKTEHTIDTASFLQKGVYASIREFRNNNPSIKNYHLDKDENGMAQLFLEDEAGEKYFSRKMWGYCDGKDCYIMMDGNLFPLLHVNNAYYVWGSTEYKLHKNRIPFLFLLPGFYAAGLATISESVNRKMNFFTLDIGTGSIY